MGKAVYQTATEYWDTAGKRIDFNKKKVLGIIQARSTSKRLPGKIFKKIGDKTILEHCLCNCLMSKVDQWVIAMPKGDSIRPMLMVPNPIDLTTLNIPKGGFRETYVKYPEVRENDVLGRFARVAEEFPEYEWIVRITADCPFVSPNIIDQAVEHAIKTNRPQFDYFNEGSAVCVFRREDLLRADKEFKDKYRREHVVEGFRKGFKKRSIDTQSDLNRERKLYKEEVK